ncbi:MAG: NADH-quinone oxidoreductase subunit J [Cyclobacteriaceae bacterium]|nr:NADH-quinone oxidoreductase subunit J [Cyclobacteriaceae bacterium HetDA_MAG_MS6]
MTPIDVAFFFFLIVTGLAGIGILLTRNVIHAAMLLVIVLLGVAGLYVLFRAEFAAVVQVLIYAGGIVVLIAFGVMLTNRPENGKLMTGNHLVLPALLVSSGLFYYLVQGIQLLDPIATQQVAKLPEDQVEYIGAAFMTDYIVAFELIAFILLVVLVGAAYLAKHHSRL